MSVLEGIDRDRSSHFHREIMPQDPFSSNAFGKKNPAAARAAGALTF